MRKLTYPLIGLALVATAAQAQQADPSTLPGGPEAGAAAPAPPAPPEPAPPADAVPPADASPAEPAAPPADASAAESTSFTDEQVDQFAEATVKVQAIDADTSVTAEEKQSKMAAAVTAAGLDPATYNKIGQAIAVDPELRTRVQVAMAKHSGGAGEAAEPSDS